MENCLNNILNKLIISVVINTICGIFFCIFLISSWKCKQKISIFLTILFYIFFCITSIIRITIFDNFYIFFSNCRLKN